jgi:hypothetical protein
MGWSAELTSVVAIQILRGRRDWCGPRCGGRGDKDSAYGRKSDAVDGCAAARESIGRESRCIHVIARFWHEGHEY